MAEKDTEEWSKIVEWIVDFPRCHTCAFAARTRAFDSYAIHPSVISYLDCIYVHMLTFEFERTLNKAEKVQASQRYDYPILELPIFACSARFHAVAPAPTFAVSREPSLTCVLHLMTGSWIFYMGTCVSSHMKPIWTRMRPVNFCVKILLIGYFFSP
jgi:hypothetical protein